MPEAQASLINAPHRKLIMLCVILATLMQALDTTIANVALPFIQGSVSASQDQIAWVLTSYIVAAAIMTPPAGFLVSRFGTKRVLLVSVTGFTIASMLCGLANSLVEIVLYRVLQGLFGAALVPLAQTILMNISPREKQGRTMAIFGAAVMAGPVLGPVLGGWLTEFYSWRYVFFINLPVGVLAFLGLLRALPETGRDSHARLDWTGFATLSIGIGALQVMLDRGQQKDWFASPEIMLEAGIAGIAFYLFLVQIFTAGRPFVQPAMFRDRNFAGGTLFIFIIGLTYYASMALQPPFVQNLMGYPVLMAGLVMGPRGIGTMIAMQLAGVLIGKVELRLLLGFGLGLTAFTFYLMTGWNTDVAVHTIVWVGILQGAGLGFIFVPLTTVTLSTLPAGQTTQGAGLFNLSRNIGSSIGISVVNGLIIRNTQINHAEISRSVTDFNHALGNPSVARFWDPHSAAGGAALDAAITTQAQIIAYVDDYKLLMLATIAALPLLVLFRAPRLGGA